MPYFARFIANKNFAPEQLNGYELGYRKLIGKQLYLDVATFYNHYHDLFDEEITGAPFIETTPAPSHVLLPAQFGNGLLGATKESKSRRNGDQLVSGGCGVPIRTFT